MNFLREFFKIGRRFEGKKRHHEVIPNVQTLEEILSILSPLIQSSQQRILGQLDEYRRYDNADNLLYRHTIPDESTLGLTIIATLCRIAYESSPGNLFTFIEIVNTERIVLGLPTLQSVEIVGQGNAEELFRNMDWLDIHVAPILAQMFHSLLGDETIDFVPKS